MNRGLVGVCLIVLAVIAYAALRTGDRPAPGSVIARIPQPQSIPHAYTIVPRTISATNAERIAAADALLARFAAWKDKGGEPIPYADWHHARTGLLAIDSRHAEFADARDRATALDMIAIELSNAEIKVAERLRLQKQEQAEKALRDDVGGRKRFADDLERELLRQWFNVELSVTGEKGTTLRLRYIGVNRPFVFNFQENVRLLDRLREKGFRRVQLTDGYRQTWNVAL